MTLHGPSDSERQEREWLEGMRYEDKFPDDECPACGGNLIGPHEGDKWCPACEDGES